LVAEAFSEHRLRPPKVHIKTLSVHLRANIVATRSCITTFPWSVLLFHQQLQLKMLPVDLPARSWPIIAVTLRHRTPSPIVARFLESARAVSRSISGRSSRHSD
jgi:DNA-binding transcriptional LysR family regulator